MLNANEYLANIYGVLVKIDDRLSHDNSKQTSTAKEKTATQGMGFNLKDWAKNPEAVKQTSSNVKDLAEALKTLSVGTMKFWLVPKAAKNAILDFITSLSTTTTKHRVNIMHGMAAFSNSLEGLSSNLWKFWLLPKFVKNSIVNFFDFTADSKRMKQSTQNLKDLFGAISEFGKNDTLIKNISNMADSLTKSFKEIGHVAKNMALLFLGIGGAILIVAGALYQSGKWLGGVGPIVVLSIMALTIATITGIFWALTKFNDKIKAGAETGKEMGKALMYISGGVLAFVLSWKLIAGILGTGTGIAGFGLAAIAIVAIIGAFAGIFWLLGKKQADITKGADTAKAMGVGLLFIAGGMLAIVGIAYLFSKLANPIKDVLAIALIVGALVGMFYLMGKYWQMIVKGALVSLVFSIGVYVLSLALKPIIDIANMIEKMRSPGKTFLTLGLVMGALIGIFYLVGQPAVAGFVALGAAVITAMVVPFYLIGETLIKFATATKSIMDIAASYKIDDIKPTISKMVGGVLGGFIEGVSGALAGGKKGWAAIPEAIKNSAVIFAGIGMLMGVSVALSQFALAMSAFANIGNMRVIEGYDSKGKPIFGEKIDIKNVGTTITETISSFLSKLLESTEKLTKEKAGAIRKMGRALTGRRGMLSAVIGFAEVIKTFSQFGNKGEIIGVELVDTGKVDKDGNPIWEEKKTNISITNVVGNIVTSLTTFISGLADNVDNFAKLTSGGPMSPVKRIGRQLTGRRGILSAITGFAEALKVYAEFGNSGNIIGMELIDSGKKDADGNVIWEEKKTNISIQTVVGNMMLAFTTFVDALAGNVDEFAKISTGGMFSPMKRVARALSGKNGILGAVVGFAEALTLYSKFGADGSIPLFDADGKPIIGPDKKPMFVSMEQVAKNIVKGLTDFSSVLANALDKDAAKNAKGAKGTLGRFDDLIEQFNKLSTAQEGLAKVASTIGLLAQNIGALSTNLNALDSAKFDTLTNGSIKANKSIAIAPNTSISKDAIIADKANKINNTSNSSIINYNNTTNVAPSAKAEKEKELVTQKAEAIDYEKLGAAVAGALRSGQWKFEFSHDKSGVMMFQ